jgi:hypothetical protein
MIYALNVRGKPDVFMESGLPFQLRYPNWSIKWSLERPCPAGIFFLGAGAVESDCANEKVIKHKARAVTKNLLIKGVEGSKCIFDEVKERLRQSTVHSPQPAGRKAGRQTVVLNV